MAVLFGLHKFEQLKFLICIPLASHNLGIVTMSFHLCSIVVFACAMIIVAISYNSYWSKYFPFFKDFSYDFNSHLSSNILDGVRGVREG